MRVFLRQLMRLITAVLSISLLIIVLGGALWYVVETNRPKAPQQGYAITAGRLEHAVIGLYLRYRGEDATQPASADGREVTFVVTSGESVSDVAYHLQEMGLLTDPELFRRVVQYWEADGDVQVGVYTLRPNMTMEEIMRQLQHGRLPTTTVTIPEGWRVEEIAALLDESGITGADDFLLAVRAGRTDFSFLQERPAGASASLEGFLFPDTYRLPKTATADKIVSIMLQTWSERIPAELRAKAADQGLTLYEAITLASIVEREAVLRDEQPIIAGVYLNRIAVGMYLQSDPTVQYAKGLDPTTGRWWNPMIQEEAITVVSPYNTFLNSGLPPSPICNPGAGAIRAVLEPEPSDYLFFYAKGDGSHAFAVTYEEHLQNEALYGAK
jgi:UPF0755 protein